MANQGNLFVTLVGGLVVAGIGGMVGRTGLDERIDDRVDNSAMAKRIAALDLQVAALKTVTNSRAVLEAKAPDGTDVVTRLGALERDVRVAVQKAERANQRLSQARLSLEQAVAGQAYTCGNRDIQDAPYVMVGLREGSGCGTQNQNYYRKLSLAVPSE